MKNLNDMQDRYKMTDKTEQVMDSHPNLDSAPMMLVGNAEDECGMSAKMGDGVYNRCAPDNNLFLKDAESSIRAK